MSKRIIASSLLATLWMCLPASAQDVDVLERLFGAGVHAYYSGDYQTAHDDLSSVIQRGTKDPRPYYFRALALMRLGRPDEAQTDLAAGSDLETQDIDGSYPVSRSLERVQGSSRAQVEKYRMKARLESLHRKRSQDKQRYEAIQKREAEVLRRQVRVPIDGAPAANGKTPPAAVAQPPAVEGGEADPFAEPKAAPPAADPATEPAAEDPAMEEPAADDATEPAAEEPAAEEPASDDPFAEPAPKAKGAAKKPAAEPADDAASGDEPAADDPFAEPTAKPKAAPKAAPKKAPAAESDDPFGGDAAMEEDTPPADDAADAKGEDAAESDDPFGGAEPATKTPAAKKPAAKPPAVEPSADEASEDPFGGASDTEEMPADEKGDDAKADEDKPADDNAADDGGGDPFGDDEKAGDDDKAADDKPAKDAKPAEEKDDSDPFGN